MRNSVEIENIEAMRLLEGIDDVELREGIRGLAVGDLVKLTLLAGGRPPRAKPCWSGSPASEGPRSAASWPPGRPPRACRNCGSDHPSSSPRPTFTPYRRGRPAHEQ